ncbi:MAG: hypothetical protein A3I89_00730 [Candidatus Harrisonbacteria bacterium RIFCSPLOWO2_02_FULL_41_11]|uniref:Uncharacterized protein n=1 Tax=Candidatus Harrisonbacteria bacterium RIFCSPHIGHO2_02_FULL_42_16 TaxID=1798404 RepID=A0A1G1ZFD2_9BACT|nr:MAG: hypothetical protein A3B92_03955 [Candidatus Harrisonbacteria bacterium RIFCSPHIGHO2_02_FULL_42_16]OGY67294.1 MAG: hypothetical protein A3I89_00730 [Candidatus Harrisonbacteria bacterium RIFCSPLOWO2_02_FULL_41_11]
MLNIEEARECQKLLAEIKKKESERSKLSEDYQKRQKKFKEDKRAIFFNDLIPGKERFRVLNDLEISKLEVEIENKKQNRKLFDILEQSKERLAALRKKCSHINKYFKVEERSKSDCGYSSWFWKVKAEYCQDCDQYLREQEIKETT